MHIVFFDIDGTLLRSGGAGKAAMEAALGTAFGVRPDADPISFSGRTDRAIGRDLFRLHGVDFTEENWDRFLGAYLEHLPGCLKSHNGSVLPGIARLLEGLRTRHDVGIGLLTGNVRVGARAKLGYYGLYDYFGFGGFGDVHWDRDAVAHEAMEAAQSHVGVPVDPSRVWVIGDTPLDVQCARAIRARAVAVATGWHSFQELQRSEPDLLLADLADPAPLLARLTADS